MNRVDAAEEQPAQGPWQAARPSDITPFLSRLAVPWWIAGGWALDLFAGKPGRLHGDLDVGILRRDILTVLAALPSWEFYEARDGILVRLHNGETPRAEVNSLWGRPAGSGCWTLELMLDQSDQHHWIFRRDPRVRRPLTTIIRHDATGIPYLAPEIQLLYKARSLRQQDQADFDHIAPLLDADARTWLESALCMAEPDHHWIAALATA